MKIKKKKKSLTALLSEGQCAACISASKQRGQAEREETAGRTSPHVQTSLPTLPLPGRARRLTK